MSRLRISITMKLEAHAKLGARPSQVSIEGDNLGWSRRATIRIYVIEIRKCDSEGSPANNMSFSVTGCIVQTHENLGN
jgi:hypothetical protein